jgi:hypothetical protein
MTRSDLIDGAKRFPEYASTTSTPTDSSNRLEHSPISTSDAAAAFSWWNFITSFVGDVVACASGCFAAYAIEIYWLGIPSFAFQGLYFAEQLFWLAAVMVVCCGRVAYAQHHSGRHPFHEDLRGILSAPLVGFAGCVEFAYETRITRLWLLLAWLFATLALPLMRVAVRRTLTTSGTWVVKAAMTGLGRLGTAVKELLGGGAYLRYQVTSAGPRYTKDLNGFRDGP